MSQRVRNTKKGDWAKKDITLMTLLANEATADSRKLLSEYQYPDAKNHEDLEQKLAELYFRVPDKIELEKKMAKIHPHRDWILKYEPKKTEIVETKKEEKPIEGVKVEETTKEVKTSSASGDDDCPCVEKKCACQKCMMRDFIESKSNAEGSTENKNQSTNNNTIILVAGIVGIVGLATIIAMTKSK